MRNSLIPLSGLQKSHPITTSARSPESYCLNLVQGKMKLRKGHSLRTALQVHYMAIDFFKQLYINKILYPTSLHLHFSFLETSSHSEHL